MIVCRKRNFVFLRIPKTASSSIAYHLIKHIPKDEIDEFSGIDFLTKELGYNFETDNNGRILSHEKESLGKAHITINQILKNNLLTEEDFNQLNFYVVVRDPVDRFLSGISTISNDALGIKFASDDINSYAEYYISLLERGIRDYRHEFYLYPQTEWITKNSKLIVYPYFQKFLSAVGVPTEIETQLQSMSRNSNIQRQLLSSELEKRIQLFYKDDMEIYSTASSQPPQP